MSFEWSRKKQETLNELLKALHTQAFRRETFPCALRRCGKQLSEGENDFTLGNIIIIVCIIHICLCSAIVSVSSSIINAERGWEKRKINFPRYVEFVEKQNKG